MSEDTDIEGLKSDWVLLLGTDAAIDSYWNDDGSVGPVADLEPGSLGLRGGDGSGVYGIITTGVPGESGNRFGINDDGSLHWGDGTAAPDVSLSRVDGGLLISGALLWDVDYGFAPTTGQVLGLSMPSGNGLLISADGTNSATQLHFWNDYTGGGRPAIEFIGEGHDRVLFVDADGDLAIEGVGKITTH